MKPENTIVHSVWVGGSLSLLEQLTIRLLQKLGHVVCLWTYEDTKNIPSGVIVRNAAEILSKESIFRYTGIPFVGLKDGGLGSLSHWSDQFQFKLLYKEGGIYTQLDVAYFKPLDFECEYLFVPLRKHGILPFLMKGPKNSPVFSDCYDRLNKEINKDTISNHRWGCSMCIASMVIENTHGITKEKFPNYFLDKTAFQDMGTKDKGPFYTDRGNVSPKLTALHWSNATIHELKNNPIKGSMYHRLLKEAELI